MVVKSQENSEKQCLNYPIHHHHWHAHFFGRAIISLSLHIGFPVLRVASKKFHFLSFSLSEAYSLFFLFFESWRSSLRDSTFFES